MNILWQCPCEAKCGTVISIRKGNLYFQSVVAEPEKIDFIKDGFINGKWSIMREGKNMIDAYLQAKNK